MNGIHDLGGMHGFGAVELEVDEPVFHQEWEARTFAMAQGIGALRLWTMDEGRATTEQMPPTDYIQASYYERWLYTLEQRLTAVGMLGEDELLAARNDPQTAAGALDARALRAGDVAGKLRRRGARLGLEIPARYLEGDRIRTDNQHPHGHTRLPRYARGRSGTIHRDLGVFTFADARAARRGDEPQHVYSVRFSARELWGDVASSRDHVHLDLYESYLLPA